MRFFLFLALITIVAGITGCESRPVDALTGNAVLPFDLLAPSNQPADGDYYGESGVVFSTQTTILKDSLSHTNTSAFQAQFRVKHDTSNSSLLTRLPAMVFLNGAQLRVTGLDTVRLGSSSGAAVLNDNIWKLADSSGDTASFTVPKIDGIDSVLPFATGADIRGDVPLPVRWNSPFSVSGGMSITWQGPGYTYRQLVDDGVGAYEIPKDVMTKLRGRGNVYFTRYLNVIKFFRGKKVVLTRMTQRKYEVTVN
ncbi:MAG: hypothetical protein JWQ98_3578 [Chlorobi bacterium]|jgi:hypothetical protein|nr:hypothetical protein [Chlorobiota bacterium]